MNPVEVKRGEGPLVLGLPHTGTYVPEDIFARLTPLGQTLSDTDWHIDRLYDGLLDGVTTVRANFHRYVIDANRDPSGASLYPGQNTTGLVPMTDFDGRPLWLEEPDETEIEARRLEWYAPYHAALQAELERVRAIHGVAILYDCHSIRSNIPYLFEGTLPDFNIGRLDDAPLRPARGKHARHPDGTGTEHPPGERDLAFRLRRREGRAAARSSQDHSEFSC